MRMAAEHKQAGFNLKALQPESKANQNLARFKLGWHCVNIDFETVISCDYD